MQRKMAIILATILIVGSSSAYGTIVGLYTDSTGNVGIGTITPSQKLNVVGPGGSTVLINSTTNTGSSLTLGSGLGSGIPFKLRSTGSSDSEGSNKFIMTNASNNSDFLTISGNNGNIGIGTNSPQNKLDVNGGLAVGSYAGSNAATSNGAIISGRLGLGTLNPSHQLSILMSNSGIEPGASVLAYNEIAVASNLESTATYIFNQNGTSGIRGINAYNDTSRLALPLYIGWLGGNVYIAKDGGNVGIGTTNPGSILTVKNGDVFVPTQGNGIILRDTNGSGCHRITVNSAGTLSTAVITCPSS